MSNSVLQSLLKTIYSTMCDEYTNCSNHEQLTFYLHWVEALKAHKTFLGFYKIPDIKSSTVVSVIKDILTRYQLRMKNFRGQRYDGASNMLGKTSGVAVELQKLQPKANYTHCHVHSLFYVMKKWKSKQIRYWNYPKQYRLFAQNVSNEFWIMALWKLCLGKDNMATEVKSRIAGVKMQMEKFDFFFGLNIGHRLYSHTNNLSKTLQAKKCPPAPAKGLLN